MYLITQYADFSDYKSIHSNYGSPTFSGTVLVLVLNFLEFLCIIKFLPLDWPLNFSLDVALLDQKLFVPLFVLDRLVDINIILASFLNIIINGIWNSRNVPRLPVLFNTWHTESCTLLGRGGYSMSSNVSAAGACCLCPNCPKSHSMKIIQGARGTG